MKEKSNLNGKTSSNLDSTSREWVDEIRMNPDYVLENADEFDLDAQSGWKNASEGTSLFVELDKKYIQNGPLKKWMLIGVGIVMLIPIIILFNSKPKNETSKKGEKLISTKQTEIQTKENQLIPEIEKMIEIPEKKQIKATELKSTIKSIQTNEASNPEIDGIKPSVLPLKKINAILEAKTTYLTKKPAKEINIYGMKLVDYRSYRSKSEESTSELPISGTPANVGESNFPIDKLNEDKRIELSYHDYISETMRQFSKNDYKQTLQRALTILKTYPDDINALFYAGICFYNLTEFSSATSYLNSVVYHPFSNFDEEALWYMAQAYSANGESKKAKELFQVIYKQNGFYAEQAFKKIQPSKK
jgi:tetratricopeptide (TPR) repeat protein